MPDATLPKSNNRRSTCSDTSTINDTYVVQEPIPLQETTSYVEQIREQLPPGVLATRTLSIQPYPSKDADLEALPSRVLSHHSEKRPLTHYVNWEENDPECPYNWSKSYRYIHTMVVALFVVSAAFGSSVITGRLDGVVESFGCSHEVAILQVSLMVIGFMIGPLLWSPASEIMGRKPIYIVALGLYTVFNIPCAVAKNIETVLVCRFFCGFFASVALTLAGGSISDIFPAETRGYAVAYFAAAPYAGPVLGPIVGGWISIGTQSWRWIYWVNMIFAGVTWILSIILPETYHPILLARRAKKLRKETGDPTYVTVEEEFPVPISELVQANLIRPFVMLATEPILILMSLYIAIIYALLYAFFFAYPIIFGRIYHMNDGFIGLTFIGILIGAGFALIATPYFEKIYRNTIKKNGKATPEDRLMGMMFAAPFVPISLFIFSWTSYPWVHWIGPVISGLPFGFGMVLLYYSANNYLIDCFSRYVTSALAAKVLVRSSSGAAFPLFIEQMYDRLGDQWASTLLAFISLAIVPIPFAFYRWGAKIRAKSRAAS
ncbi:MFS general substrate transporter [Rhizopus microsporus var. microsporus]|uniref:MFS general substrate transporter n=2 Tax=Rhizopus microsporus TaxID=58291 RepID=A0A2G4SGB7_RHIZD|nr:MFS general substrate transporter [Rhizopus microsporus ATCC 52813]ORE07526.1 MFS general substrate transporter [Rhizopus microsporus var. microsporus]PHZ07807.1 MFS general substrate transporter [Rhizopus microsporus ATCC 52813]